MDRSFKLEREAFLDACAQIADKPISDLRRSDFAGASPAAALSTLLAAANSRRAITAPHRALSILVRPNSDPGRASEDRHLDPPSVYLRHDTSGISFTGAPFDPHTYHQLQNTGEAGEGPEALCCAVEAVLAYCDELVEQVRSAVLDINLAGQTHEVSLSSGHPVLRVSEKELRCFLAGDSPTIEFADVDGAGSAEWHDDAASAYTELDVALLRLEGRDYVIQHPVTARRLLVTIIAPHLPPGAHNPPGRA
jgi:hypothetical protein